MRHYPSDSPEAMTRVVALALLADGVIDLGEMEVLKGSACCFRLGIDPCRFEQIVDEFCDDVRASGKRTASGHYALNEECVRGLLMDIKNPDMRRQALSMMIDIIGADGVLAREETALIAQAVDCWKLGYRAAQTAEAKPNWQAQFRHPGANC